LYFSRFVSTSCVYRANYPVESTPDTTPSDVIPARVSSWPMGPHRETHYTNWWRPRKRGVYHLLDAFFDLFPVYTSQAVSREAVELIDDLTNYVHTPATVAEYYQSLDEASGHATTSSPMVLPIQSKSIVLKLRDGTVREISKVDAPVRINTLLNDATDRYVKEVTETQLVSMIVQQCHRNYGIRPRNRHNELVYDRYALSELDKSSVPVNIQAKIMPIFRLMVFVTNKHEARAMALANTPAVLETDRVVLRPPRLWRGWFLSSAARNGSGEH